MPPKRSLPAMRYSISRQPQPPSRTLEDLPEEILRIILAYCCSDLDHLLWSCPAWRDADGICQACLQCTVCGKQRRNGKKAQRSMASTSITTSTTTTTTAATTSRTTSTIPSSNTTAARSYSASSSPFVVPASSSTLIRASRLATEISVCQCRAGSTRHRHHPINLAFGQEQHQALYERWTRWPRILLYPMHYSAPSWTALLASLPASLLARATASSASIMSTFTIAEHSVDEAIGFTPDSSNNVNNTNSNNLPFLNSGQQHPPTSALAGGATSIPSSQLLASSRSAPTPLSTSSSSTISSTHATEFTPASALPTTATTSSSSTTGARLSSWSIHSQSLPQGEGSTSQRPRQRRLHQQIHPQPLQLPMAVVASPDMRIGQSFNHGRPGMAGHGGFAMSRRTRSLSMQQQRNLSSSSFSTTAPQAQIYTDGTTLSFSPPTQSTGGNNSINNGIGSNSGARQHPHAHGLFTAQHTSSLETVNEQTGDDNAHSLLENDADQEDEDKADMIQLSAPFQYLMVNKMFANAAVPSLWQGLVFHGHESDQAEALLSTLNIEDCASDDEEVIDTSFQYRQGTLTSGGSSSFSSPSSVSDPKQEGPRFYSGARRPSINALFQSLFRSSPSSTSAPAAEQVIEEQKQRLVSSATAPSIASAAPPLAGNSSTRDAPRPELAGIFKRRHSTNSLHGYAAASVAAEAFSSPAISEASSTLDTNMSAMERPAAKTIVKKQSLWPYRRYVKRVVLNFAHPQASPKLLVKVLECIGERCRNQIQSLDLHANEKMQAAGLELTTELERLFGSGFSKLKYLRLQGGFVDNRLLSALIKGMVRTTPMGSPMPTNACSSPVLGSGSRPGSTISSPFPSLSRGTGFSLYQPAPCRLSQVFLGPGSVTDTAIEKLVAAASHSLEVFTVTSCVDVSGGAIATLLTRCPKLRVLGIYRSLAKDKDLLRGLGIEVEEPSNTLWSSAASMMTMNLMNGGGGSNTHLNIHHPNHQLNTGLGINMDTFGLASAGGLGHTEASFDGSGKGKEKEKMKRKQIIAPLERLELAKVKLTQVGVEEILKGVSTSLKYLVLETQHISEEFLRKAIVPLCLQLEGLHFDDPLLTEGGGRQPYDGRPTAAGTMGGVGGNQSIGSEESIPGNLDRQESGSLKDDTAPAVKKLSPWFGETMTDDWVHYGDCALRASAAGPTLYYGNNNLYQHQQNGHVGGAGGASFAGIGTVYQYAGDYYHHIGEKFGVERHTIEFVLQQLNHLRTFTVMQMDLVSETQALAEFKRQVRQDQAWRSSLSYRLLATAFLVLILSAAFVR